MASSAAARPASIFAARSAARDSQAETLSPSRSAADLTASRVSLGMVIVTRSRLIPKVLLVEGGQRQLKPPRSPVRSTAPSEGAVPYATMTP